MPEGVSPSPAPLLQGLAPVVDARTRLMVLGSFPGMASLAAGQYYAHPRNQFWPLLSAIWGVDLVALPYGERLARMLAHGVGLWDVYAHCRREGSLDSAIRDPVVNDLPGLRRIAPNLHAVAHNGGTSARLARHLAGLGLAVAKLPSTSPAHAAWRFERKLDTWRVVFEAQGVGPVAATGTPSARS